MTIRLKVFISSGLSLLLIAVLLAVLLNSHLQVREEVARDEVAENLVRHASDFLILIDEYLVTRSSRAEEQWHIKYQQIMDYLKDSSDSIDTGSLKEEFEILFQNLNQLTSSINSNPDIIIRDNPRTLLLTQQIMLTNQAILLKTFSISKKANKQIKIINDRALFSIVLVSVLVSILIIITFILTVTRVSKPLTSLVQAVRDLSFHDFVSKPAAIKESKRNDEVDELSHGFNVMTDNLFDSFNKLNAELAERQKAEQRIVQIRNFLRNILDSMPFIIISLDDKGHVIQWNKKAQVKTGIQNDQALHQPIDTLLPELAASFKKQNIGYRLSDVRQFLQRQLRDDHTELFEEVTVFPLSESGRAGIVLRIEDISERKKMEEIMIQSEKILSVGGLAAGMAHEINNPLAGLTQTANVLAKRLWKNVEIPANKKIAGELGLNLNLMKSFMEKRDIPRMLDAIDVSGKRIAEIVTNMLSFARKSDEGKSSHNLPELLDKTIELAGSDYDLKKHQDFKKIIIQKEYDDQIPRVSCEAAKIQQVFLNLFRNGAQAMQEAEIENPRFILRIKKEKTQDKVCIEVEDNGPGMDENTRKRIFEPFFTTKPAGIGTGLGLSVSYFIITENHNGEMSVKTAPGKGTKFTIRLPV